MIEKVIPLEYQELHDPDYTGMNGEETTDFSNQALQRLLERVGRHSPFYQKKFKECGFNPQDFSGAVDFGKLPFTYKEELREGYPLGLQAVSDREVVRIHSSSGTTGKPVIIPYTKKDVYDWSIMFARCYAFAGITREDRVQITPGYAFGPRESGFSPGEKRLSHGDPDGPGNTENQLQIDVDLKSTVLCSTSSYALLLAEEIKKRNLRDRIYLKIGIIVWERWVENIRDRIENELGVESFDIYGLTEIYGQGNGIDCKFHQGIHYWSDHLYFEIIDPLTGLNLPDGELGELVITTLSKEGAPLIRYRTRDLTRIIPGTCPCGSVYPRIDGILGRSDDMIKSQGSQHLSRQDLRMF